MISSPYVSTPGSERLIQIFSAMKSKDASISLITYPASHYSDDIKDRIENIHNRLNMAGIKVSFVDYIPSRYAVIDKEILWYGSMNLVSNIKEDDDENCQQKRGQSTDLMLLLMLHPLFPALIACFPASVLMSLVMDQISIAMSTSITI